MTAAILQGAPGTTLDVDLWVDLPSRGYMRMLNLCRKMGAEIISNTIVVFEHTTTVNFLYEVHGLRSFGYEYRRANRLRWLGQNVVVLPLERILRSKKVVGREKDLAHVPLLERTIKLKARLKPGKKSKA